MDVGITHWRGWVVSVTLIILCSVQFSCTTAQRTQENCNCTQSSCTTTRDEYILQDITTQKYHKCNNSTDNINSMEVCCRNRTGNSLSNCEIVRDYNSSSTAEIPDECRIDLDNQTCVKKNETFVCNATFLLGNSTCLKSCPCGYITNETQCSEDTQPTTTTVLETTTKSGCDSGEYMFKEICGELCAPAKFAFHLYEFKETTTENNVTYHVCNSKWSIGLKLLVGCCCGVVVLVIFIVISVVLAKKKLCCECHCTCPQRGKDPENSGIAMSRLPDKSEIEGSKSSKKAKGIKHRQPSKSNDYKKRPTNSDREEVEHVPDDPYNEIRMGAGNAPDTIREEETNVDDGQEDYGNAEIINRHKGMEEQPVYGNVDLLPVKSEDQPQEDYIDMTGTQPRPAATNYPDEPQEDYEIPQESNTKPKPTASANNQANNLANNDLMRQLTQIGKEAKSKLKANGRSAGPPVTAPKPQYQDEKFYDEADNAPVRGFVPSNRTPRTSDDQEHYADQPLHPQSPDYDAAETAHLKAQPEDDIYQNWSPN